jgi:hypothetical protein
MPDTTPETWEADIRRLVAAEMAAQANELAERDATIRALRAELAFTLQQLAIERQRAADCATVVLEWEERVKELAAALEPLAALESGAFPACGDDFPLIKTYGGNLTLGDVRRAKRALGEGEK